MQASVKEFTIETTAELSTPVETQTVVAELNALELALVGGGVSNVSFR